MLGAVITNPIDDSKTNDLLEVSSISHTSASVAGGQDVIILCEKARRDDIKVLIIEQNSDQIVWKKECKILNVHHECAIVFRIPAYNDLAIVSPQMVHIQLYQPSDGAFSELIPFELLPCEQSKCQMPQCSGV